MSQVSIAIGGKNYTIACGPGEEDRIRALAAIIDDKYAQLGSARAALEAQNLVFASLFLADELAELRGAGGGSGSAEDTAGSAKNGELSGKKAELKAELETLRTEHAAALASISELEGEVVRLRQEAVQEAQQNDDAAAQTEMFEMNALKDAIAQKIETLADKAEAMAQSLEAER